MRRIVGLAWVLAAACTTAVPGSGAVGGSPDAAGSAASCCLDGRVVSCDSDQTIAVCPHGCTTDSGGAMCKGSTVNLACDPTDAHYIVDPDGNHITYCTFGCDDTGTGPVTCKTAPDPVSGPPDAGPPPPPPPNPGPTVCYVTPVHRNGDACSSGDNGLWRCGKIKDSADAYNGTVVPQVCLGGTWQAYDLSAPDCCSCGNGGKPGTDQSGCY